MFSVCRWAAFSSCRKLPSVMLHLGLRVCLSQKCPFFFFWIMQMSCDQSQWKKLLLTNLTHVILLSKTRVILQYKIVSVWMRAVRLMRAVLHFKLLRESHKWQHGCVTCASHPFAFFVASQALYTGLRLSNGLWLDFATSFRRRLSDSVLLLSFPLKFVHV